MCKISRGDAPWPPYKLAPLALIITPYFPSHGVGISVTGSFHILLFEGHLMFINYTCDSKSQTLCMRYLFQSTGRLISHRNGWSFRVYMIPLRDFVPEWNSCPGTRTGVTLLWGDSRRHDILWWYNVNKYGAMRGNRSELAPGRKSNPVSCKHPLSCQRTPPAIT